MTRPTLTTPEAKIDWLVAHPKFLKSGVRLQTIVREMKRDGLYSYATNTGDTYGGLSQYLSEARKRVKASESRN